MELLVIFEFECMHAWFQFVFSSFLPQRFAGPAFISCIFDVCKGLELLRVPRLIPAFSYCPGELAVLLWRHAT
jgi:hypothetical protein